MMKEHLSTALKVSKYEFFSGPYFAIFRLNTEGKYGPEKTLFLDIFHAVKCYTF